MASSGRENASGSTEKFVALGRPSARLLCPVVEAVEKLNLGYMYAFYCISKIYAQ